MFSVIIGQPTNALVCVCVCVLASWTSADLPADKEIVDEQFPSRCQLTLKYSVQRFVSIFLWEMRCHTLCTLLPSACLLLTSPAGLTSRCLRQIVHPSRRERCDTGFKQWAERAQCWCSPWRDLALRDFSSCWLAVNEGWDRALLIYVPASHGVCAP